jgi:hypothetical protein
MDSGRFSDANKCGAVRGNIEEEEKEIADSLESIYAASRKAGCPPIRRQQVRGYRA